MREPDQIHHGFAVFGRVIVDLADQHQPISIPEGGWYSLDRCIVIRDDLADAIAWYEARQAEGR